MGKNFPAPKQNIAYHHQKGILPQLSASALLLTLSCFFFTVTADFNLTFLELPRSNLKHYYKDYANVKALPS